VKERRRILLIDLMAKVDWSNFDECLSKTSNNFTMVAYGKLEIAQWVQFPMQQNISVHSRDQLNFFLGCLMLSALNEERVAPSSLLQAPFDFVRRLVRWAHVHPDIQNLFSFITDLSREELLDLATLQSEDPYLLSDFPTVWEVFFHEDQGLAKVKRQKVMAVLNKNYSFAMIVADLLKSLRSPEVELKRVLIMEGLVSEEHVKKAMTDNRMRLIIAQRACDLWLEDKQVGKTYFMGVVQVYLDIFHGELDNLAEELAEHFPVHLLVLAEEKVRSERGQEWTNLLKTVQVFLRGRFRDALSLKDSSDIRWNNIRYNRECDWYELLMTMFNESPEIKNKIPSDYASRMKVHSTWQCSLFRVWIQFFGEEVTRRQVEEVVEDGCLWQNACKETKDGELLHMAVELSSLIGVKKTAYPKMLTWRNRDNRTALELAEEKLGKSHEVTEYLGRMVSNLTECSFL